MKVVRFDRKPLDTTGRSAEIEKFAKTVRIYNEELNNTAAVLLQQLENTAPVGLNDQDEEGVSRCGVGSKAKTI